jgi:hypothetical protein
LLSQYGCMDMCSIVSQFKRTACTISAKISLDINIKK